MKNNISKIKYTDEDILKIAQKMHDEYEIIFLGKKIPKVAVSNLARLLEEYPQEEDKKMITLEYAARIKFEIQNAINHVNFNLSRDKKHFIYNKSSFAVRQATKDVYGYGKEEDIPEIIKSCVDDAYFWIVNEEDYEDEDILKLRLK